MTSASWNLLGIPFVVVLLGVAFFLTQFRVLNTLLIGDESALTLGIQVATIRKVYLVFSSAITGVAVAVSGTIGFVGLIIPPCCAYACRFRSPQGIGVINDSRIYFFDLV